MTKVNKDEDKATDAASKAAQEALDKMNSVMEGLPNLIANGLNAGFKSVQDSNTAQAKDNQSADKVPDVDLEDMDRKELVSHATESILKSVETQFKTIKDELTEQISATSKIVHGVTLKDQLKEAQAKFTDFNNFKVEIGAEAEKNPTLSVENLYHLAKANNPDKVEEESQKLQKIMNDEAKEKAPKFGGLTPTSSLEVSESGKMDKNAAAEDAWGKSMGDVSAALIGMQN